jgi:hypothetical protein
VSPSREFLDITDSIIGAINMLKIDPDSVTSLDLTSLDIDADFLAAFIKLLPNLYKLNLSNIKLF